MPRDSNSALSWRLVALLICLNNIAAWANELSEPVLSGYKVKHWTTDETLLQNSVDAVQQTQDGYIWICTRSGLNRFDGRSFEPYTSELGSTERGSNDCRELVEDTEGRLWIRTVDALISYYRGQFQRYTLREEPVPSGLLLFRVCKEGGLWLLCYGELQRFEHGRVTQRFDLSELTTLRRPFSHLREDREGRLWVGDVYADWVRFDPWTRKMEELTNVVHSPTASVHDLLVDRPGRLWLLTEDDLLCWSDERLSRFSLPHGPKRVRGGTGFTKATMANCGLTLETTKANYASFDFTRDSSRSSVL